MLTSTLRSRTFRNVLLALACIILTQPLLVATQPQQQPTERTLGPIDILTASGDTYLSSISQATRLGVELMPAVEAINQAPLADLSESFVIQNRDKSLEMARQSAMALGAVDDMADSIEVLGTSFPEAFDLAQRAGEGLPSELRQGLIDEVGLSTNQVDTIQDTYQTTFQARLDVATQGLPQDIKDQLLLQGFEQAEIDHIATTLGTRGLADVNLSTSLQQFRATQDEIAGVRTRALILLVQLMGKQIAVRQSSGVAPRPVTDEELAELANDELRLLIHVAQLDELWGNDPRLSVGEGHWWFIERYATRAAERLDTLVLESQNRGLIVDLLLARQMQLLALTARSGDADYVKAELDNLAELLAHQVGDATFVAVQRSTFAGRGAGLAQNLPDPQNERLKWPVAERDQALLIQSARAKLDASGVDNLTSQTGTVAETNESNNSGELLFAAGLPYYGQLAADVYETTLQILTQTSKEDVVVWVKAILTGDTENPVLLAANMVLSMLPVIGAIPDIYSLVADPSIFVKALSLIGIIGSIGDLAVLLGVTVPIAAAAALSDAASAILKALYKGSRALLGPVLDAMRFTDAFKVAIDLVKVVVARIQKLNLDLTNDPMGAVRQVLEGTGTLWESFVAFAHRAGMDMLLRLGVDEGSILVGSVLRRGGTLSDDAIVALDNIADDVPEVLEFSDEAIDGLGDAVEALGEQKTRLIFAECIASAFSDNLYHASKVAGHASPMSAQGLCKQSLEVLETLTKEAQQGFNKIDLQLVRTILLNYPDKAQDIGIALTRFPGRASQIAQNAVEAYRHNLNIDLTYRGLAFASDFNRLGDLDLQVARELNARGDILLGVDDNGVKKVLGIPDNEVAPDLLARTEAGRFNITEVKDSLRENPRIDHALSQLRNAVKHLNTGPNAVNDAKIGVLEIAIRSNKLPPPFEMRGNQLVKVTDEGEQVVKITDAGLDAGPGQSGHVVTIRVMPIGAEN